MPPLHSDTKEYTVKKYLQPPDIHLQYPWEKNIISYIHGNYLSLRGVAKGLSDVYDYGSYICCLQLVNLSNSKTYF